MRSDAAVAAQAVGPLGLGSQRKFPDPLIVTSSTMIGVLLEGLIPGSPADFGRLIADDTEKWAKVVKLSGAKPE
jgi:hypothetical protein